MTINEIGGKSIPFDKTLMRKMDPKKTIEIDSDGRAMQQELEIGEF